MSSTNCQTYRVILKNVDLMIIYTIITINDIVIKSILNSFWIVNVKAKGLITIF
jgi:hypothetical protein